MKRQIMSFRPSLLEIFLFQMVGWLAVWLMNNYIATLLTLTLTAIVFAVLVIALIAEAIDRSKVPRLYFWIMAISIVAPILAALTYLLIFDGKIEL